MASAAPPPPPPLTFCSQLTPHPPFPSSREWRRRAPWSNRTWWESTLHVMKQLSGGQTNYRRLTIWFNYVDKIKDGLFRRLVRTPQGQKVEATIHRAEESSVSVCPLITSASGVSARVRSCLRALNLTCFGICFSLVTVPHKTPQRYEPGSVILLLSVAEN